MTSTPDLQLKMSGSPPTPGVADGPDLRLNLTQGGPGLGNSHTLSQCKLDSCAYCQNGHSDKTKSPVLIRLCELI
jgi:hypothetical protein